MSIRFNASGESLSRARLTGARTAMGWFRIVTDRNDYSSFLGMGANRILATGSDGTTLIFWDGSAERTGPALTVGVWYHLAVTISAESSPTYVIYRDGTSVISDAQLNSDSGTNMYVGNDEYNEWLNGNAAFVKIWSVVLTAAEVQQEMYVARPVRTADLHLWTPILAHTDVVDYSGNARNWTANGTLTTEDGPPVSWGAAVLLPQYVASAGGDEYADYVAAAGAATVSVAATSQAAATATTAAGAATVSVAGASQASATATAVAGVATVSVSGASQAATTATAAAGAATVSVGGASQAAATATAAAGVATVSASAAGASVYTPAAGVATVSVSGASQAVAATTPAAGVAMVSVVAGGASVYTPAAGVSTVSVVGGSQATTTATTAAGAATVSVSGAAAFVAAMTASAGAASVSVGASSQATATATTAASATVSAVGTAIAQAIMTAAAGVATVSAVPGGLSVLAHVLPLRANHRTETVAALHRRNVLRAMRRTITITENE